MITASALTELRTIFTDRLQERVALSGYTAARIGGPADVLIFARSADQIVQTVRELWRLEVPFLLLGGGSNVLVSDNGVRGAVIINRARTVKFDLKNKPPTVTAESGTTLNDIAQRASRLGLSGLEWAASIPGSLGGAVYGNAGAFGGDIAHSLVSVEVLLREQGRQTWPVEKLEYGYRSSLLKRQHIPAIILSSQLVFSPGDMTEIKTKMEQYSERRRKTQPPGASMGSMFKNPEGDKAGRLIEAASLKGKRIGTAEISSQHANFFINHGDTRAEDMKALIDLAQETVAKQFSVNLELEVELAGEW